MQLIQDLVSILLFFLQSIPVLLPLFQLSVQFLLQQMNSLLLDLEVLDLVFLVLYFLL